MTPELIEFDRRRRGAGITAAADGSGTALRGACSPAPRLTVRHILVPFDGSPLAERTAPFVAAVARAFSARVTILRVLEHGEPPQAAPVDALEWEMARAEAHASLKKLAAALENQGCEAGVELLQGRAAEQISHFAGREAVDLIVLSSHGAGGLHGWHLASTVHKVIASAPSSVLVVPAQWPLQPEAMRLRRILVPLDCSQRAECILPAASELARAHEAELLLAHVVPEPEIPRRLPPSSDDLRLAAKLTERNRREARHYLLEAQGRLASNAVRVDTRLSVSPRINQALQQMAREEQVDLVVLCAHGRAGDADQRYGSVAASFLHEGAVPTLILQDFTPAPGAPTVAAITERPGH